jgi:P4 family phage/plasmid primase-like protien
MKTIGDLLAGDKENIRRAGLDALREEFFRAGSQVPASVQKVLRGMDPVPVARGDQATLAQVAILMWSWHQVGGVDTMLRAPRPVFCNGHWYVYHCEGEFSGTWRKVTHETARKCVGWLPAAARWNTVDRDGGDKTQPIRMGKSLHDGVSGLMKIEAAVDDDYFDLAPPGMSFSNGFLTDKLELVPHHESQLSRNKVDYEWNPGASPKPWLDFLDSVWEGEPDLEERKRCLGEWLGACVLGRATKLQRAVMMLGKGSNGKSILADAVVSLFNRGDVATVSPQDLCREYDRASLQGKKLNVVADVSARELIGSGDIKMVINGDHLKGRHPYGRPFTFMPVAGHLFSANELPRTTDLSDGFFRRWVFLTFNRKFGPGIPGSRQPDEIDEELRACRSGIIAWAVKLYMGGAVRKGLFIPVSSKKVRTEWRSNSDQVVRFILECCLPVEDLDQGKTWTSSKKLYSMYKDWARENNNKTCSQQVFSRRVKDAELPNGYKVIYGRNANVRGFNLLERFDTEDYWEDRDPTSGDVIG